MRRLISASVLSASLTAASLAFSLATSLTANPFTSWSHLAFRSLTNGSFKSSFINCTHSAFINSSRFSLDVICCAKPVHSFLVGFVFFCIAVHEGVHSHGPLVSSKQSPSSFDTELHPTSCKVMHFGISRLHVVHVHQVWEVSYDI